MIFHFPLLQDKIIFLKINHTLIKEIYFISSLAYLNQTINKPINQSYKLSHIQLKMQQFQALLHKNFILYKRQPCYSFMEIFIPILSFLFVLVTTQTLLPTVGEQQQFIGNMTYDYNQSLSTFLSHLTLNCSKKNIALVPQNNPIIDELAVLISNQHNISYFDSDEELDLIVQGSDYGTQKQPQICFGISIKGMQPSYEYDLRFPEGTLQIPQKSIDYSLDLDGYLEVKDSGVPSMVTAINTLIARRELGNNSFQLKNSFAPIYQQKYEIDLLFQTLKDSFQSMLLFALLTLYMHQIPEMINQKEKKIREVMLIMGMKKWLYYLTWFIRYFFPYLVVNLAVSGIFTGVFPQVPYYVPFVLFLLFHILLITQAIFVQVFFTKQTFGSLFGMIFFMVQYSLVNVINFQTASINEKIGISVIPHAALVVAVKSMLFASSFQIPVNFTSEIKNYTLQTAIISLILNIIFYGILTWYLDQVVPNEFGVSKHPCFCFVGDQEEDQPALSEENFEETSRKHEIQQQVDQALKEMEKVNKVIKVKNITKIYDEKPVVNQLNLTFYADHIFALIGHNGAGKTTLISMITGLIQPTSGSVSVFGQQKIEEIRNIFGLCPQHDTLYNQLTVEDHLRVFGSFRGLSGEQLQQQISALIKDLSLEEKRFQTVESLSGGQKRKLSVALAFIGGTKVIILDEPTAGMDASARRLVWQMLKKYKNGRIILLTTHLMDEADYLGDRIGIMAEGNVVACGSSVYLKNKYGSGYKITFTKESPQISTGSIIECLLKHVKYHKVISDISTVLSVQLSLHEIKYFPSLFDELDEKKQKLGVKDYGISITSLEEVFLKVGQKEEEQKLQDIEQVEELEKKEGQCSRFTSNLGTIVMKRLIITKRDYKTLLCQLIIPIILLIAAFSLMSASFTQENPVQKFSIEAYLQQENPVILPIASSNLSLALQMKNLLQQQYKNKLNAKDFTSPSEQEFDEDILFPLKKQNQMLKGGLFVEEIDNNEIYIRNIINTKFTSALIVLQTLAAQAYINSKSNGNIQIKVSSKNLPLTKDQAKIGEGISGFFGTLIITISLASKFGSIAWFIVKERVQQVKYQQIVSGLNIVSYWLGNFIFDYIFYVLLATFSLAMCFAFEIRSLIEGDGLAATCVFFLLYGFANIPFTYFMSFFIDHPSKALAIVFFFNGLFSGLIAILISIFRLIQPLSSVGRGLAWFFRILPTISFTQGIINTSNVKILSFTQNQAYQVFDLQIATAPLFYLAITFFLYFCLVFVIQYIQTQKKIVNCCQNYEDLLQEKETEEDVKKEQKKALEADPYKYEILTKNIKKVFKFEDENVPYKAVVDNVSLAIQKGEIFGLLGVNGAGKTTFFKMLTGQIIPTSGEGYVFGQDLSQNISQIRKNIGYCPQFDALFEFLTVREHLQIYFDLKFFSSNQKQAEVNRIIKQMNLTNYQNEQSQTLSGGTKRRLSVAISLIGNPQILFLDEPSAGVDPKARKFMWNLIEKGIVQKHKSTVILTTHSIQEAQAISTRATIMVQGRLKCLGSVQHIKEKYGRGYEIEVKLFHIEREQILKFIQKQGIQNQNVGKKQFQEQIKNKLKISKHEANLLQNIFSEGNTMSMISLVELHLIEMRIENIINRLNQEVGDTIVLQTVQTYAKFKIMSKVEMGKIFRIFQANKKQFLINSYSIRQVTLEQIFNDFAEKN